MDTLLTACRIAWPVCQCHMCLQRSCEKGGMLCLHAGAHPVRMYRRRAPGAVRSQELRTVCDAISDGSMQTSRTRKVRRLSLVFVFS